jgi:hypothetical protein
LSVLRIYCCVFDLHGSNKAIETQPLVERDEVWQKCKKGPGAGEDLLTMNVNRIGRGRGPSESYQLSMKSKEVLRRPVFSSSLSQLWPKCPALV